jgi:RecB family exonuclease
MSINYLSFSGAQSYENCPAQFAHRRIWKTPIDETPPSDPIILGNNFHSSLQKEAEEVTPITTASPETQKAYKELVALWEGSDNQKRFEELTVKKMIPEFEFLLHKEPYLHLRGFIDVVGIDKDGNITIFEIKTGGRPYPKKYLTQVNLYVAVWNYMSANGLIPYGLVTKKVLIMATTKEPRKIIMREYDLDVEDATSQIPLHRMERVYQAVTKAVTDDNFPKNPTFLCGWCNYQDVCRPYGALHNLGK